MHSGKASICLRSRRKSQPFGFTVQRWEKRCQPIEAIRRPDNNSKQHGVKQFPSWAKSPVGTRRKAGQIMSVDHRCMSTKRFVRHLTSPHPFLTGGEGN